MLAGATLGRWQQQRAFVRSGAWPSEEHNLNMLWPYCEVFVMEGEEAMSVDVCAHEYTCEPNHQWWSVNTPITPLNLHTVTVKNLTSQ